MLPTVSSAGAKSDDCNIYVGSQAAAERVLESLTGWITRHLRLEVSVSKSGTGRPWERKFDSGAHRAFTPFGGMALT